MGSPAGTQHSGDHTLVTFRARASRRLLARRFCAESGSRKAGRDGKARGERRVLRRRDVRRTGGYEEGGRWDRIWRRSSGGREFMMDFVVVFSFLFSVLFFWKGLLCFALLFLGFFFVFLIDSEL